MNNYIIGDIQGCYHSLQALLSHMNFQPKTDRLWTVGDLVNRGPNSLEVLKFFTDLPHTPRVVLGNHDLHLLAVYHGIRQTNSDDTINDVLEYQHCNQLMDWLIQQPLLYHHQGDKECTMVHAGIPPQWDLTTSLLLAHLIESDLRAEPVATLETIFGNTDLWSPSLSNAQRHCYIINAFTRMRMVDERGHLKLQDKGPPTSDDHFMPWFSQPEAKTKDDLIIFGHWAALAGKSTHPKAIALDTGCVWGESLTAYRLEDGERFSVQSVL